MKQVFDNLIEELKTNNKLLISVANGTSFNKIISAKNGDDLISEYGSIENFFENIFQKGNRKIAVTKYKRNGSGILKLDVLNFDFSEKSNEIQQPIAIVNQPIPAMPMNNNIGMNGTIGLGFTQMLEYGIKANERDVLSVEVKFLREQNEALKKTVEELKEERLASKYDAETKKNNSSMLMGAMETFAPLLMNAFGKSDVPTSLNAPAQQVSHLSAVKQQMIDFVESETTYDVHIQFLLNVIEKVNADATFYEKVVNLINEPANE